MNLTTSQNTAIHHDSGDIIVSASAGSGKTFVMIERIKSLILSKKASLDNILAVTFTNLAGSEMKEKLSHALLEQIASGNDSELFKEQLKYLPNASISTIHSFCLDLLKTYFYACGLDASFQIADTTKCNELKDKAMQELFEELYESNDENLLYAVKILNFKRNDKNLREYILNIHKFICSEKDPTNFLKRSVTKYNEDYFKTILNELLNEYRSEIHEHIIIYQDYLSQLSSNLKGKLAIFLNNYINYLTDIKNSKDIFSMVNSMDKKFTIPKDKGLDDSEIAIKPEISEFKKSKTTKLFTYIKTNTPSNYAESFEHFLSSEKLCQTIVYLTDKFYKKYSQLKAEENVVDFNDLEHFTFDLLSNNQSITYELKEKYKYIFVDEYQDVNGIQEALISLISNNNLFMVGDVKQSIYAFRGSNPDIFSNKFNTFNENQKTAITLENNFRSSKKVLSGVNHIFKRAITKDFGGIDYALNPMQDGGLYGKSLGECTLHCPDFNIKDTKTESDEAPKEVYSVFNNLVENKQKTFQTQSLIVAKIIENALANGKYYDIKTAEFKPYMHSDIVIILRSFNGKSKILLEDLQSLGIMVSSEKSVKLKDFYEIQMMINIMKLIDNFTLDIPLITALKSPIGGLSDFELLEIRKFYPHQIDRKTNSFYYAYLYFLQNAEGEIYNKLVKFNEYFKRIRLLSQFENAGELMLRIVRENNIDLHLLSSPFGSDKLKRVNTFINLCGKDKNYTVNEFLQMLTHSLDDLEQSMVGGDDSIKVMTAHHSKGLEFPMVILPNLDNDFNNNELKNELLINRHLGFSINNYDYEKQKKTSTIERVVFKKLYKRNSIMEETRIFYVAMTRAKYSLNLVSESHKIPQNLTGLAIKTATCPANFISLNSMKVTKYSFDELESTFNLPSKRNHLIGDVNDNMKDKFVKNLQFEYPYIQDTTIPVKRSVSSINSNDEGRIYEITSLFGSSTAEMGTAYHKFLQVCDFYTPADIQFENLIKTNELSKQDCQMLDKQKLQQILNMQIFKDLKGYKLYKEKQFLVNIPAKLIMQTNSDKKVLVQGVVDLLAISGDKAIIIDYKLSKIKNDSDLVEKYSKQLNLYKYAVEVGLKKKVEKLAIINILQLKEIILD